MLWTIGLNCVRVLVTKAKKRTFKSNTVQQVNTYIQQMHSSPSVKGHSRSANKKRAHIDDSESNVTTIASPKPSNKVTTNRSVCKNQCCSFNLIIFCSSLDQKWYLRHSGPNNVNYTTVHQHHLPSYSCHTAVSVTDLSEETKKYISECLHENIAATLICNLVRSRFNIVVTVQLIMRYRDYLMYQILEQCNTKPFGSPVEALTAQFSARDDVSFLYITHDYNTGYVTHRKSNSNSTSNTVTSSPMPRFVPVYQNEIKSWRHQLKVPNSEQILVAFAWCHDEEFRSVKMFPEFLAVDMTFGVNKQQRNLLLIAGIDGHNSVFTAFHCFMPSKQTCAYAWALQEAARHLLTEKVLVHNRCFACDQEQALYLPIRQMITSTAYLSKSHNRLDQFHLFKKEWKDKVVNKVNSNAAHQILQVLQKMLSAIFDYIETPAELEAFWSQYNRYYSVNRPTLRSDPCCESIESIVLSLKNNINYICHYKFKHVTTFGFVGDCIAEAANSGIKNGSICVSTNMNLNTSGLTQLKIVENQTTKKLM
jgi:hypothetical protein